MFLHLSALRFCSKVSAETGHRGSPLSQSQLTSKAQKKNSRIVISRISQRRRKTDRQLKVGKNIRSASGHKMEPFTNSLVPAIFHFSMDFRQRTTRMNEPLVMAVELQSPRYGQVLFNRQN